MSDSTPPTTLDESLAVKASSANGGHCKLASLVKTVTPFPLIGSLSNLDTAGRRLFFVTTDHANEDLIAIIRRLRSA